MIIFCSSDFTIIVARSHTIYICLHVCGPFAVQVNWLRISIEIGLIVLNVQADKLSRPVITSLVATTCVICSSVLTIIVVRAHTILIQLHDVSSFAVPAYWLRFFIQTGIVVHCDGLAAVAVGDTAAAKFVPFVSSACILCIFYLTKRKKYCCYFVGVGWIFPHCPAYGLHHCDVTVLVWHESDHVHRRYIDALADGSHTCQDCAAWLRYIIEGFEHLFPLAHFEFWRQVERWEIGELLTNNSTSFRCWQGVVSTLCATCCSPFFIRMKR